MLESLNNKIEFKERNYKSWLHNTEFWLHSELRQLIDTKEFLSKNIPTIINSRNNNRPTIIDMGTGSGWFLELLNGLNLSCNFVGIDFNPLFIEHLQKKYNHLDNVRFITRDLEDELPVELSSSADYVFNFFNFFEMANLEKAFENASAMLKPGGKLIIMTIESLYLMFALSKDLEELKNVLKIYEEKKNNNEIPFFFQKIDLGNSESDKYEYASVLYSVKDYFNEAKKNHLMLLDFDEIVKTSRYIPKVYQFMQFQKL